MGGLFPPPAGQVASSSQFYAATGVDQTVVAVGVNLDPYLTFQALQPGSYSLQILLSYILIATVLPAVQITVGGTIVRAKGVVNWTNDAPASGGFILATNGGLQSLGGAVRLNYEALIDYLAVLSTPGSIQLGWGVSANGGTITLSQGSWAILTKIA